MSRLHASAAALVIGAIALVACLQIRLEGSPHPQRRQTSGWQLPPDAADTRNPLTVDEKVLAQGRKIFADKCRKCHGPEGLGDGPDADPERVEEMNLTNPKRADRNPDGIVFYKVSNGRTRPKMPAFKDELTTEQIWAVVSYVQTLRKKP